MDMESRNKNKKHGIKRFIASFLNSFAGLQYAYKYEQSMLLHLFAIITTVVLGIFLKISIIEWAICVVALGLIMGVELINTSLEAVVDLCCPQIHPLAKIAKDTASAAVFTLSTTAVISELVIFVPKLLELL